MKTLTQMTTEDLAILALLAREELERRHYDESLPRAARLEAGNAHWVKRRDLPASLEVAATVVR